MSQPPPFVLPPEGRGARVRAVLVGAGRQRVAVALLALAALLGAGVVWARATPRLAGVPAGQGAVAPADQTLPRAAPDTPSATGPRDRVAVHVAGRVRRPGPRRHPAAGGVTAGADLDAVNLARRLTDGEQVRIPGPGDPAPPLPPDAAAAPGVTPSAPLDLNTATLEQLDALPGVGEVTAGHILAYRSAHPFTTVDQLLEVPGIGQRRFDQLKDLVTVA
jgi:competence protein ComEA